MALERSASYASFWSGIVCVEAQRSLKDSRQADKNKPFHKAQSETHDTLRGDKPPPVIFPSRKLYTETDQIWFENINSIYLREEMRCWVKGGAAGFKHNRNQTPFSGPAW